MINGRSVDMIILKNLRVTYDTIEKYGINVYNYVCIYVAKISSTDCN